MYEDAFLLIGKLAQNDKVVKEIRMTKKGFRVRWVNEKQLFWYRFSKIGVQEFYELYEIMEREAIALSKM